ncbi:MAG: hypothetical protein V2I43_22265 [Parvularcula sp.]|jgi:hypothetical protein|nr:hypothetical protein [Parvularcula sp.]
MTGAARFDGLGVNGNLEGQFFGPGAESIGATFIGTNGTVDTAIVGSAMMNKDR